MQECIHANYQHEQRQHGVLLAVRWDTFAAQHVSPRPLGIIKCINEGPMQGIRVEKSRCPLTAIEKLAIGRGQFYYVEALVKEKQDANFAKNRRRYSGNILT